MDRFWEAHDFIIKAMTTHDGPFNWESEHFHYRQVNVWPRPWQQPHPPVWSTTASKSNARVLGERGYVIAVLGSGYNTRSALRRLSRRLCRRPTTAPYPAPTVSPISRCSRSGTTRREARRRGELVADYLRTGSRVFPPFKNPPGYLSVDDNVQLMRGQVPERSFTKDGRVIDMRTGSVQDLIDSVLMFCGTPDQVLSARSSTSSTTPAGWATFCAWRRPATSTTKTRPTTSRCWRRRSCRGCRSSSSQPRQKPPRPDA